MPVASLNIPLSGITAATQRLNLAASNLANQGSTQTVANGVLSNEPYVPQQAVQTTQKNGGVALSSQAENPPSVPRYDPSNAAADSDTGITQYPNIDPAQQLIQANVARYDAQGNISVLKVQNKLYQSVLNIVS